MPGIFTEAPVYIIPPAQTNPTALKQIATEIVSKARGADEQRLLQLVGRAISSVDSAINPIMTALRRPVPQPTTIAITDSKGVLIAWIGSATSMGKSWEGAWFQQLYVGGQDASTAKLVADSAGNLTITNARIVLNGSVATIVLDPIRGEITVTDVGNTIQTVIGAQGIIISGFSGVNPTTVLAAGQLYVTDVTGTVQARVNGGGFDTGALGAYAIQGTTVIDPTKRSFFKDLTINGTLAINSTRDSNFLSVTVNTTFFITQTGDAVLNSVSVGTGVAISAAGVVSSTNGFTGSQTYVKTVNFVGSSVTTGTVTSVAGIVTNMT